MKSSDVTFTTTQQRRLVCCAVQDEEYCFDLSEVRSITRANQMAPHASPESMSADPQLGWVAAQQDKLPVYDLAHRLQLAPKPDAQTSLDGFIVLLKANQPFALRVDRITGSVDIPCPQFVKLPPMVAAGTDPIFKGIAQLEEKWLLCADANQLRPRSNATSVEAVRSLPEIVSSSDAIPTRTTETRSSAILRKTPSRVLIFLPAAMLGQDEEAPPIAFGLSITQVQQVTKLTKIIPVPNAPSYVFGIINWRNLPVPVIDLKVRLGIHTTPANPKSIDPNSRLLIARGPQQTEPIGFLVTPQVKTFHLPIPYQPLQQPLTLESSFVKGIFDLEGTPFVIPDLDAILTSPIAPRLP